MTGLPRSIIKKYGVTKKAWRIYRAKKSRSRRKTTTHTTRKRKRSVRHMAKRKRTYRRKGMFGLGNTKTIAKSVLIGLGVASVIGGVINNKLITGWAGLILGGPIAGLSAVFGDNLKGMLGGLSGSGITGGDNSW